MHEYSDRRSLEPSEPPDLFYALVTGAYAALLSVPPVLFGLTRTTGDPGVRYVGLLGSVTVVAGLVAAGTSRWHGAAERLGATRGRWGLVVLPLAVGAATIAVAIEYGPGGVVVGVGPLASLFGAYVGYGLVTTARTRYLDAVLGDLPVECEWSAAIDGSRTKLLEYTRYGLLVVTGAVFAQALFRNAEWFLLAVPLAIKQAILLQVPVARSQRSYQITPAGLERLGGPGRPFHFWDAFEGYVVTDDALVLQWRAWWRPDTRLALADIENVEAVTDALGQYLPRA